MASSGAWRGLAIFASVLGGAAGIVATHKQINEGNQRRLEADEAYRRQLEERLGIPPQEQKTE